MEEDLLMTADDGLISVVLLVHNEAAVIERVVEQLHEAVVSKRPGSEIVIIEDGSTDGTQGILERMRAKYPIVLDSSPSKRGYTEAFRRGLRAASHACIFLMDAGGKYDAADFWRLYDILRDCDLVIGAKRERKDPPYRVLLSWAFNWLIRRYFRVSFSDINSGFRVLRRPVAEKLLDLEWRMPALISFEMTLKAHAMGFEVREVPISHFPRGNGPSRGLPLRKIPKAVWHTLRNLPIIGRDMRQLRFQR